MEDVTKARLVEVADDLLKAHLDAGGKVLDAKLCKTAMINALAHTNKGCRTDWRRRSHVPTLKLQWNLRAMRQAVLVLVKDAEDPQQNNDWDGDSDQPKQNTAHRVFLSLGLLTHQRIERRVGSSFDQEHPIHVAG
jgi:hypothetical protein